MKKSALHMLRVKPLYQIALAALICFIMTLSAKADLSQFKWENRLVLIFTENIPSSKIDEMVTPFKNMKRDVKNRDLRIFAISEDQVIDIFSQEKQENLSGNGLRKTFNPNGNSDFIFLLGKDGGVKFSSNEPVAPQTIFKRIDSMPMRIQEMKNTSN